MLKCCYCPKMFQSNFLPWHIFTTAPASLAQFGSALDNSKLDDSQPCFLTFHRIIMGLAGDSSCVGTSSRIMEVGSGPLFTQIKRDKGKLKISPCSLNGKKMYFFSRKDQKDL